MEGQGGECHLSWRSWSCGIILEKCSFVENIQLLAFWAVRVEKKYGQERKRERKVEKEEGEVWKLERWWWGRKKEKENPRLPSSDPATENGDCRSLPPWSGQWSWMAEVITGHFLWGPRYPNLHYFFLRGCVKILIACYIWSDQYLSPGIWKSFSHIYLNNT